MQRMCTFFLLGTVWAQQLWMECSSIAFAGKQIQNVKFNSTLTQLNCYWWAWSGRLLCEEDRRHCIKVASLYFYESLQSIIEPQNARLKGNSYGVPNKLFYIYYTKLPSLLLLYTYNTHKHTHTITITLLYYITQADVDGPFSISCYQRNCEDISKIALDLCCSC